MRTLKETRKEKILENLEKKDMATSLIANMLGINFYDVKPILEELLIEKKVKKIEEHKATYWRINATK